MPVRGVLENSAGPLTAEDIALMTGFPERIFAAAFESLQKPGIQWILAVLPASPDALGESPGIPGHVGAEGNRTEQNRIEGNRTEEGASLPGDPLFLDHDFTEAWGKWEEFRKGIKPKLTEHAKALNFAEVKKLSGDNLAMAIEIVNQTLRNSWKGFFELKGNHGAHKQSGFKSAHERKEDRLRAALGIPTPGSHPAANNIVLRRGPEGNFFGRPDGGGD